MKPVEKKIAKETFWGFATKFTVLPFFLLMNVVLTRMLGPELWGEWTYFYSFFNIIFLLALFGVRASQKYIAQHNETPQLYHVFKAAFRLRVGLNFFFALVVLLLAFIIPPLIGRHSFRELFMIASLVIFFSGFVEYFKGAFMGLHRVKYNFIISSSEFSMKLLLIVTALYLGFSLPGVLWALVLNFLIITLLCFFLIKKHNSPNETLAQENYASEIIQYSLPLFLISIGFTVATEVDTLMLGMLSNDLEVGDYGVAKQLIVKLPHISYALAMGSMPLFAKINSSNLQERKILFSKLLKLNALIFIPAIVIIIVAAPFLIPLVYGSAYTGAVLPLQILSIYVLIFTSSVFYNQFLDYQHRANLRARNLILSLLLNIALNYWLIPLYGAWGAAVSTSVSYLPYLLLNIWEVRQIFQGYAAESSKSMEG